jgi:DNA mismatch endonuclease, patch repair protein
MADHLTPEKRRWNMQRIRSEDTKPEKIVRSLLHQLGFRFRLHRKKLPGSPDIVLPKYQSVIFVHGCFWHRHPGCSRATTPRTRQEYWLPKFRRTVERDRKNQNELRELGWNVIVIWECEIRKSEELGSRFMQTLTQKPMLYPIELAQEKLVAEDPNSYDASDLRQKMKDVWVLK